MSDTDTQPTSPGLRPVIRRPGTSTGLSLTARPPELPSDLQREGARRLSILCFGLVLMSVLGSVVRHIAIALGFPVVITGMRMAELGFGAIALLALILGLMARSNRFPTQLILNLGLCFEVILVFTMACLERLLMGFGEPPVRMSFAVVVLLTFPIAIPTNRKRRYLTSLASAVALPAGALVASSLGPAIIHLGGFLLLYMPTWLAAGFGVITWRVVYRLGQAVRRARQLGNYQLVHKLGSGSMGEVWQARHRHLVRPAAVKLIRPEKLGSSPDTLRRFEREAQATASLRSPHTVELYDFGVSADNSFYYAMEFLDGIDLDEYVQRFGPMRAGRVVYVLRQVCKSLAEAHAVGLVHRDIKPANLIVCCMGVECDFVKVLDFGLVKPEAPAHGAAKLTGDGANLIGTPAFMAPEQALGHEVDGRTDLYSVGCVAFWLLTGELVFSGKNAFSMSMAHMQTQPPAPSTLAAEISSGLDDIVLACLAKSPEDRPQSALELYHWLEAAVDPAGGGAVEPWTDDAAHDWWQRHGDGIIHRDGTCAMVGS